MKLFCEFCEERLTHLEQEHPSSCEELYQKGFELITVTTYYSNKYSSLLLYTIFQTQLRSDDWVYYYAEPWVKPIWVEIYASGHYGSITDSIPKINDIVDQIRAGSLTAEAVMSGIQLSGSAFVEGLTR